VIKEEKFHAMRVSREQAEVDPALDNGRAQWRAPANLLTGMTRRSAALGLLRHGMPRLSCSQYRRSILGGIARGLAARLLSGKDR
jgi:hypothetical protein